VLWSGGAKTRYVASCPPHGWHLRTDEQVLTLIARLASDHTDHHVAEHLNAMRLRTQTGKPWTYARVASVRRQHTIPTCCPVHTQGRQDRADGFMPAAAAARQLGVSLAAVRVWAHNGVLIHDQRTAYSKIWVRLTEADRVRLDGNPDVTGLPTVPEAVAQTGTTRSAVWQRVRDGELVAYRSARSRGQWEWRLGPRQLRLNGDRAAS
jgi:hypothetical protein